MSLSSLVNHLSAKFFLIILLVTALVNLLGALGPELAFDALWYHLTIPKIYLSLGQIQHLPGGLLYYSEMPRLAETLYLFVLPSLDEIGPHLVSWGAGIGTSLVIYKLGKKLSLPSPLALLPSVIFYVTPLVGWQSGSAYVDLLRTFFEILALYFLVTKKPTMSGLAIGLAISTKTLALGSLGILAVISHFLYHDWKKTGKLILLAALVCLPWFLSAFLTTGNPLYPIGSSLLDSRHKLNLDLWNLPKLFGDFFRLWFAPEDPITPVYLLILPFFLLNIKKLWPKNQPLILYSLFSILVWYITPRTGGGRFIMAYLPAWAILIGSTVAVISDRFVKSTIIAAILFISLLNLLYRGAATTRLSPYLLGRETKTHYLCRHLDFATSVFVDCGGFLTKTIKKTDLVYVAGVHNLYYIDFPFVHESWYRAEEVNYILTQSQDINAILDRPSILNPSTPGSWQLIHENTLTKLKLYQWTSS
ncbi:MAG: hypothetical protein UY21_C0011G0027 [Microgenomates group bacterium GW2011_GWA1_48_10]|uniref:Glycosyltransferase RgtA/B/C/D-like domain-containing protein n=1 Tax=Candidatus Gottesmanbacteria bacterium RIFCSPHIGHO2_01_FULL_47_48 TaxID=1798381 RepID=A0A1F6A4S0_9BACT|nr:MAG: hypothetical protein UY21_C0011G0027 [Microgenomates group bacterium GW2011_GWA1_48_10]OGG19730.1 MAG: hypothetical protein A2721_01085 [Candidatus Gottesmanbacteria bacterium RIFCSPHIGHO2_01_FULL_47_48]